MIKSKTQKKHFSLDITKRFLQAMDQIIADRSKGKITADAFGKVVQINSSNLSRLRILDGKNSVTLEACGILCKKYGISPEWLILGDGEMYSRDKSNTIESRLMALEKVILKGKKG